MRGLILAAPLLIASPPAEAQRWSPADPPAELVTVRLARDVGPRASAELKNGECTFAGDNYRLVGHLELSVDYYMFPFWHLKMKVTSRAVSRSYQLDLGTIEGEGLSLDGTNFQVDADPTNNITMGLLGEFLTPVTVPYFTPPYRGTLYLAGQCSGSADVSGL